MSDDYTPPKVWTWEAPNGGQFASINRPTAGATHDTERPVGKHPLQLYSLATPNGQKVTIMLEELLAAGHKGAEYDAWLINIGDGDQFGSGFVEVNPNSKIPALMDHSVTPPLRVFESGSILLYLAENQFMAGAEYSIADMAIFPWYGRIATGGAYGDAATFLDGPSYKNVLRWNDEIAARPAVQRGLMVNRTSGDPSGQLWERHDASDFELRTQDKVGA